MENSTGEKTIENMKVQRAETNLYGRKWIAWFTEEIPFSDGPYTFSGVPGLILSIEDSTKLHIFLLKGVRKIVGIYDTVPTVKKVLEKAIPATYSQFKKVFYTHRQDPNLEIKQHLAAGEKINMIDENGKPVDVNEFLKEQDRKVKENNAKNNNYLDLDLLK